MPNVTAPWANHDSDAPSTSCTIADEHGNFCDAPIPDGCPLSICSKHLLMAFAYCQDLMSAVTGDQLTSLPLKVRSHLGDDSLRARIRSSIAVVYYAEVGPFIKIGTTVHLKERMKQLGGRLLATEPGDYEAEIERHKQFAHLKADDGRREYFHPGDDLLTHIASLQTAA